MDVRRYDSRQSEYGIRVPFPDAGWTGPRQIPDVGSTMERWGMWETMTLSEKAAPSERQPLNTRFVVRCTRGCQNRGNSLRYRDAGAVHNGVGAMNRHIDAMARWTGCGTSPLSPTSPSKSDELLLSLKVGWQASICRVGAPSCPCRRFPNTSFLSAWDDNPPPSLLHAAQCELPSYALLCGSIVFIQPSADLPFIIHAKGQP